MAALASLRASAKREGLTVGRFGVGFAAVAGIADEVEVLSRSGAVRFSRTDTLAAVRALPSLAGELVARHDRVPMLRLPFPSAGRPAAGWVTEVRVHVRQASYDAVVRQLAEVDPTLLLVLPGLRELDVDGRVLTAAPDGGDVLVDGVRWRVVRRAGELDPALLADRPVEERAQTRWSVTLAVAVDRVGRPEPLPVAAVVRAPTPTDDPLSLPVLLAASLPLGPDRRRVVPGALASTVLRHAAEALAELTQGLADDPSRLLLVPGPLGAGEVDAALGSAVLQAFSTAQVLSGRRPSNCVVVEGSSPALDELLVDLFPGALPHGWAADRWRRPLRALGVRRVGLAELTEVLAGVDREPGWWGRLYAALPPDADQLGALPVPVVGGRTAPSPRGLLLADAALDLSALGFRVVDPAAAHPLLLRLGAVQAEPRALLEDARVRAAVEQAGHEHDPAPLVEAVLALVGAADLRPGELPWLAELPLPDEHGDWRPAGELLLAGGPLARVVDLDAGFGTVAPGTAHDDVLAAVGVLRSFASVSVEQGGGADGLDAWLDSLAPGQEPGEVVLDLDLVRPAAWAEALDLLARDRLLTPYVLWWLARHPVLDGQLPSRLRLPDTDPWLVGLLDESRHPLAARLGVVSALADVEPGLLLERLADDTRRLDRGQVRALYAHLARLPDLPLPDRVRAVLDGALAVVPAEDAVVVDRPDLLARVAPYAVVPVPLGLARALGDALDLALASEVVPVAVLAGGPDHDRLVVPTAGGEQVEVDWVAVGDLDHVTGDVGRARAIAWRAGDWSSRFSILARLRGESDPAEEDLEDVPPPP